MPVEIFLDDKEFLEEDLATVKNSLAGLEWGRQWTVEDPAIVASVLRSLLSAVEAEMPAGEVAGDGACNVLSRWCNNYLLQQNGSFLGVSDEESKLTENLNELAKDWLDSLNAEDAKSFNMDGFYPLYSKMKLKVLFIGREACWMSGRNYIDVVGDALRDDRFDGGWSVNSYPFHRRQFYIAYGIIYAAHHEGQWPKWEDVPTASQMAKTIFSRKCGSGMGSPGGIDSLSWAFINLSKISNDTGDWRTNQAKYRAFLDNEENRKNLRRQIQLLRPDIIVGANVYDVVPLLGYSDADCDCRNTMCYYYPATGEFPPFLNCYHFSAIKGDKDCFFGAVKDVLAKHKPLQKFEWKNIQTDVEGGWRQ